MAKGINTAGDVLVNQTADGVNLNLLWGEIRDALALYNQHRSAIVRLLSYPTVAVADVISQSMKGESFEAATEFGVPTALREPADYLRLGYNFRDYDKAIRTTWKFLREAIAEQVTAQVTRIFEADNRLVSGTIFNRLLNAAPVLNEWQHTCYGLWSGDGMVPPDYLGQTFTGSHTHYLTSGSATIDSQDIEDMIHHITEHAHGRLGAQGGQLIILAHPNEAEDMTFCGRPRTMAGRQNQNGTSYRVRSCPHSSPRSISSARSHPPTSTASKYRAATATPGLSNPTTFQPGT